MLSEIPELSEFLSMAAKWKAGQPVNSRAMLGDQGIYEKLLPTLRACWEQAGYSRHHPFYTQMVGLQARPAYEILMAVYALLSSTSVGPALLQSVASVSYEDPNATWRLAQFYVLNTATEPDNTAKIEVEIGLVTAGVITWTDQRFYVPTDSLEHINSNVLTANATDLLVTRQRYVDSNNTPLSLWIVTAAFPVSVAAIEPLPENPQVEPDLGTADTYGVIAASTVTNTGATTITGDLALSPGTSVTGAPTVTGTSNVANGAAATAALDANTAYLAMEALTGAVIVAGNIGGQTLTPGLYKSTSSLAVSSGDLTLTGAGVFIFQVATTFTMTAARQILLAGGATADKVFFQVGSSATLGTTALMNGNIIALASITAQTGAWVNGRLLALNGAVTLDTNLVSVV